MKQILRLFNAVPITRSNDIGIKPNFDPMDTLKKGYLFSDEVVRCCSSSFLKEVIEYVDEEIGMTAAQMWSTFHTSWEYIEKAWLEKLVLQQVLHYLTTYGLQSVGEYSDSTIYIPAKDMWIPNLAIDWLNVRFIKGLEAEEIKTKLEEFLSTGIALSQQTVNDCVDVAMYCGLDSIEWIKNKEVSAILCEKLWIVPEDPVATLRLMLNKLTWSTLLVNSREVFSSIVMSRTWIDEALEIFNRYLWRYWKVRMSSIFNRYKYFFLALRKHEQFRRHVNRISKLSKKYHIPLMENKLLTFSGKLARWEVIDQVTKMRIASATNFRKSSLFNWVLLRASWCESAVYKIRNGKSYCEKREKLWAVSVMKSMFILEDIVRSIKENVQGKKIYIPKWVNYAMPNSEKSFVGNVPSGTTIECEDDIVFGIHWYNHGGQTVDLDVSLFDLAWNKYGWDWWRRSWSSDESKQILFSGDITSAPKPNWATELFSVWSKSQGTYLLYNSVYSWDTDTPYDIILANSKCKEFKGYTIDPNDVVFRSKSDNWQSRNSVIWFLDCTGEINKFVFGWYWSNWRISSAWEQADIYRDFIYQSSIQRIYLNDVLRSAWAIMVEEKEDADIDLSIESLDKTTIIELLK